ncbi:MAG: hypothetical protein JW856_01745 [Dehalococcoidales bacterium]|nr:hypothetical protein [Dehalococcoidales bacterium]
MKRPGWFSKWFILPVILVTMIVALITGMTLSSFSDTETSTGNTATGWASSQWTQTSQSDFNSGVLNGVDTTTSSGNVVLPLTLTSYPPSGNTGYWTNPGNAYSSNNQYTTFAPIISQATNNPSSNTGTAWTNPANAYTDGSGYASITSGTPSGSNSWGDYGFSLTGNDITQVRVRYDAWSAGGSATTSKNPTANTNGTAPWTNPANAYASDGSYATAGPSNTVTTNAPTANSGAWTSPANAYADDTNYASDGTNNHTHIYSAYGFSVSGTVTSVRVNVLGYCSGNDDIKLELSANGGSSWLATSSTVNLGTGSPADNWIDCTGWTTWTSANINSNQIQARVTHVKSGGADTVYLDYLPIEVTTSIFTNKDQIYTTFGITDPATSSPITKVEIGYEAFATATQQLDFYTSANGGSSWSSVHTSGNLATSDPGSYTYIDVTADQTWTWALLNDTNFQLKVITRLLSGAPTFNLDALVVRVTYTEFGDEIRVDVSWNNGGNWSSTQNTVLTSSETTTWYDVTSATTWTPANLANGQLLVRALAYRNGTVAEEVRLDWLTVEVNYTTDSSTFYHTYSTYGIDLTGYLISKVEVGVEAYAASSEEIQVEVTWNGGTDWSPSMHTSGALGSSDPGSVSWIDCTADTTWTPTTLNDTNFKARIWYYGSGGQISLDYLPVRISYRTASGTIASAVFDTGINGLSWDALFWDNTLPSGTGITFEVRSSDTLFAKDALSPSWTSVGSVTSSTATATNGPSSNTGSAWTDPANAYSNDSSYASITSGSPSGSNVWGTYGFSLSGETITQVKVKYDAWHGTLGSASSWVSPTSDVANGWTNPAYAYNGNTGDYASYSVSGSSTSPYLELYISAITCDKVRVWSGRQGTRIASLEVDVYYNSQWNNIYSGTLVIDSYQEYSIGSTQTVTGMRVRYTSTGNPTQGAYVYEAQFSSIGTASPPQIVVDVSWDGGTSWSSAQYQALTGSETTYDYNVTSATAWDGTKLGNGNLIVRVSAQTVSGDVEVRLDWLSVEVGYSVSSTQGSVSITSGTGRYKQWRATLTTASAADTPILSEVRLYYDEG